jgi:hypothetical protein
MRYAKTVKSGESPLIVWTNETGILEVAVEDRRWPPIWKAAKGIVVTITSRVGYRMPCRSEGTRAFSTGKMVESQEKKMQRVDTKANCIRVKVAGLGNAFNMDFEEVFVSALDIYQIMQSTTNLGETGTFSASPNS